MNVGGVGSSTKSDTPASKIRRRPAEASAVGSDIAQTLTAAAIVEISAVPIVQPSQPDPAHTGDVGDAPTGASPIAPASNSPSGHFDATA